MLVGDKMIFLAIIEIFFILIGLYIFFMFILGIFQKNNRKEIINKIPKFAILIAARNEEKVIGDTVKQLKKQNYDSNDFEVIVIPNNCNDNTEKCAKESGARIIECNVKATTKGEVLEYAFTKLNKENEFDAYIIFDADNHVDENYLKEIAVSYRQGYRVARGKLEAKNGENNWITGGYTLFFYLQSFLFHLPRHRLKMSATINGTGFMVTKELIEEIGFNCTTLTEDMEFTAMCVLNGDTIGYCEKAITYDEHPTDFITSWNQRKRWSKGTMQCFTKYKTDLIKNIFINKSLSSFDLLIHFSGPILQVISLILLIRYPVLFFLYNPHVFIIYLISKLAITLVSTLSIILLCIFLLLFNQCKASKMIISAILFPLFVLTWIPINISALFTKKLEWKAIKHGI